MASAIADATVAPYAQFLPRDVAAIAADLESFCNVLTKWNRAQNLVSRETPADLWHRHIADSLQLVRWLTPADTSITDLGSGGGFPALPLAIALKASPVRFRLVESNSKKGAFLRAVIRELGLNGEVTTARAETLHSPERTSVITARAVAPLAELLRISAGLWGPATRGLFHKGREYREEVRVARAAWRFDVVEHRSDTNPEGVVLEIANLRAASGT